MKLIQKLERKFGKYAIPGIMKYVIVLYATGFIINMINPLIYYNYLMLDIDKILHGQVWRIVTFLIQPPDGTNMFFLFITLYLYYMIGSSLERVWGAFRFNLYFYSGVLLNILAVVIIYVVTYLIYGVGISYPVSLTYINQSLFLAFAALFPDMQFLIFFIIPIKVKYLGWLYAAMLGYSIYTSISMGVVLGFENGQFVGVQGTAAGICVGVAILVAMANFLIFFFSTRNYRRVSPKNIKRRKAFFREVKQAGNGDNVVQFTGKTVVTKHKCAVCGRTELDDDNLEFRFCSKCDGNYEYCTEHLFTHEHVKKD